MFRVLLGVFIVLHGLVHMWYVALSQRWVAFEAEMGWTGESWLFTRLLGDEATRRLASGLCTLATLSFVAGGLGLFLQAGWWGHVVIGSAVLSTAIVLLFWDGQPEMMVEKGLIALIINGALLVALVVFHWPG